MKFYELSPKRKVALVLLLIADFAVVALGIFVLILSFVLHRSFVPLVLLLLCLFVSQGVLIYCTNCL